MSENTRTSKAGITKKIIKDPEKKEDRMAQKLLAKEEKKEANYQSDSFKRIEKQVKDSLAKQDTDEALKSLSIGALYLGSSDVHYDNWEEFVKVRFRIDGILVDIFELEKKQYKKLLERLKYASEVKLNITDVPQDGKYDFIIDEKKIDVRLSTLPTKYGENIVCRLLDGSDKVLDFEDLGFFWTSQRMVQRSLNAKM
jgi:type II secretory ATPase GspE/PulE/Tfp pilus assembly ATPase PilB-like protein